MDDNGIGITDKFLRISIGLLDAVLIRLSFLVTYNVLYNLEINTLKTLINPY